MFLSQQKSTIFFFFFLVLKSWEENMHGPLSMKSFFSQKDLLKTIRNVGVTFEVTIKEHG